MPIRHSDLRGAARLAVDATTGLADLVEAMHERVARLPGVPPPQPDGRTRGVTGLVYKTIRGVTRLVGGSVDALLALAAPLLASEQTPGAEREAIVAALNGVLGDHLAATGNPLATPMTMRQQGRDLLPGGDGWPASLAAAGGTPLLLIHGLCMNDGQWCRQGHDHGAALQRELGFTPLYLRYNSGLHISVNGRELAQQIERLLQHWPRPVERFVIVGHSMGGLLARSALHQGTQAGQRWPLYLSDLVFLGTPHHGAPLERAGNGVDRLLMATPYTAPFARLGKLRSAGITDLRHGNLLDEDWAGADRFTRHADHRRPVPLPAGVNCCAVAASIGQRAGDLKDRALGDGLVPVASALGQHRDPARRLAFAPDRQLTVQGVGHLGLLDDPQVAAQLLLWLRR